MNLTIIYTTARQHCEIRWFIDSLRNQLDSEVQLIVVDFHQAKRPYMLAGLRDKRFGSIRHVAPKPTVWQGPARLTQDDWWAASNARNTGLCLTTTNWVAFLDDRCVLLPGWVKGVQNAMIRNYAVFGSYEKRVGMVVKEGVIVDAGNISGEDFRLERMKRELPKLPTHPVKCPGDWSFGCNIAVPTEWAFRVNGFDETADGLGFEDPFFGVMLRNSGFETRYDYTMKMVEDRTPEKLGRAMIRKDKGISPRDKSHAQKHRLENLTRAAHPINLRDIRNNLLAGHPFPPPKAQPVRV